MPDQEKVWLGNLTELDMALISVYLVIEFQSNQSRT